MFHTYRFLFPYCRHSATTHRRTNRQFCRHLPSKSPHERNRSNTAGSKTWTDIQNFASTSATGVCQVIFLNSPVSGGVIMGGLALADPCLGSLAAIGTITATATAKALNLDADAYRNGLLGYNGCLVGCAAAVFGSANPLAATSFAILGSVATPFVAVSLQNAMTIPQWTFAFNIVTLSTLLRSRPLLPLSSGGTETALTSYGFSDYILAPLTGISQIYVVE